MIKIVFMGTPEFSVPILEALNANYQVVGVVTQPDRPVGRKSALQISPVKGAALKYGIPLFQPDKIKQQEAQISALNADLIVTAAYGQMLGKRLLTCPKYGAINVHASLLPKYRGGAPIQYALLNGEKETGISIIYMTPKMDAGAILMQQNLPIKENDDAGSLFTKLSELGAKLIIETISQMLRGKIKPIPQDERFVSYAPTLTAGDERLDLCAEAQEVLGRLRALWPNPGGYFYLGDTKIKVFNARISAHSHQGREGAIIHLAKTFFTLGCGKGSGLDILELQVAGKKRIKAADFINGYLKKYEVN